MAGSTRIGAYLAVVLTDRIGFAGAFVASPVLVGLIGIVVERLLFRRFYRSDPILSLLLTFGLAMVIEQGLRIVFGAAPLPFSIPPELRGQIFVGDFIYSRYRLIILAVAVARRDGDLVHRLPHGVRTRGAGGRAEPRRGRRARHLARALHDGDRRARRRPRRARRRAAGADLRRASGHGRGNPHRRLRGGGDRRARLVLGRDRGRRCWSASCAASPSTSTRPGAKPRCTC